MRKSLALILLLATLACGLPATATPTPADVTTETYAVYAAVIRAKFPSPQVVISAQTATDFSASELEKQLADMRKQLSGLSTATTTDYIERNAAPLTLEAVRFQVSSEIILLSSADLDQFFKKDGGGWDAFYQQYPDAQGTLTFSAVGFNRDQTQALVYAGNQSHWLAGAGFYYLLEKQNDQWVVIDQAMTWIS
jgi:hypothetical protein